MRALLSTEIARLVMVDNDDCGAKDSTLPAARRMAAPAANAAMDDLPTRSILLLN